MIVGKIIGGLGNQMFCYAFARRLQLQYGDSLYLDCEWYNKYKLREYLLDKLNIPPTIVKVDSKSLPCYYNLSRKIYHIFCKIKRVALKTDIIGNDLFQFLSERGLYFNLDRYYYPVPLTNKEMKYSYGYFQSEKYFFDFKEQIRNELKVSTLPTENENTLLEKITSNNSVGISIRWGEDYRRSTLFVCKKDYYYKAMDIIYRNIDNPQFYIFSDCIDEVKKQFNFKYPVQFVEGFKVHESLRLLYSCKHFIIANSSFSWWGAYLSDYENKIVIAPNKWFLDSKKRPDIFLDNMLLLDV